MSSDRVGDYSRRLVVVTAPMTSLYLFGCVDFVSSTRWKCRCFGSVDIYFLRHSYLCRTRKRPQGTLCPVAAKMDNNDVPENNSYRFPKKSQNYLDQIWKNESWEDNSVAEEEETNFLLDELSELETPTATTLVKEEDQQNAVDESFSSSRDTLDQVGSITEEECLPWVVTVMKAGEDRKAVEIIGLWVSELTTITSFLVNMCGKNEPQIQAIARNVEGSMWNIHKQRVKRRTGTAASGWILLDYGDIIVNIMSTSLRKRYNLEGLWNKAEKVTLEEVQGLIRDQSAV